MFSLENKNENSISLANSGYGVWSQWKCSGFSSSKQHMQKRERICIDPSKDCSGFTTEHKLSIYPCGGKSLILA